jgi:nitronate monooxygenase
VPARLDTALTKLFGIRAPVVVGPMTAVSEENLVVAAAEAGVVAGLPPHNYGDVGAFAAALAAIRARTRGPFAVNLIVNRANILLARQLDAALEARTPIFITSLGDPSEVIRRAHPQGAVVVCDVSTVEHALKVRDAGADALNAVVSGAGGHAGHVSPFALVPALVDRVGLPVVCAGGVADGRGLAAALALGACGVQMGTRFIASEECAAPEGWKEAIVRATADDVVLTERLSGVMGSYLKTPELEKMGTALPLPLQLLMRSPRTRGPTRKAMMVLASRKMSAVRRGERALWSAGQSADRVTEILPVRAIVDRLIAEYRDAVARLSPVS